jgi:hypothetical protein
MLDKPAELKHCHSNADRIPSSSSFLRWGVRMMKKEDVANRKEI